MQAQKQRLENLEQAGRLRQLSVTPLATRDFASNDYLGLTQHPALRRAAIAAIERFGTGSGASRLVSGNLPLYAELENALCEKRQCPAALVFGSGFLANFAMLSCLPLAGEQIVADKLCHASLLDGMRSSAAGFRRFKHNDIADCRAKLKPGCHNWIITESIFSMDGDRAPLQALLTLAQTQKATLVVDDAHGFGLLPLFAGQKSWPENLIVTGSFSKAAGSYGGYVCATRPIIDLLINLARPFIYSTALPPATLAANLAALRVMQDEPHRAQTALDNAGLFTQTAGLPAATSCIVPVIIGGEDETLSLARKLAEEGFQLGAIRPPTVPPGTSRLRISFHNCQKREDILSLAHRINALKPSS